jgi:uncharacterized damage-inducible protein DinB
MSPLQLATEQIQFAREYTLGILAPVKDDDWFRPPAFLQIFGRGSEPLAADLAYPSFESIRDVFERVHQRVLAELPHLAAEQLEARPLTEHRIANTGLRCLWWCSQHELVHAGQMALIKRQLGYPAIW